MDHKGGNILDELKLDVMTLSEKTKIKIKQYINNMDVEKSNKLPREEKLAEIIGVSRITLRTALNDLAAEGLIFRRHGKGTFVNVDSLNIKVTFNPVQEFTEMIRNSGYEPSVNLLGIKLVPASKHITNMLQVDEDEKMVMCEKIFLADGNFCAFCVDFFPLSAIGGEEAFKDFLRYENSVFTYIYDKSGRKTLWDKVKINTIIGEDIPGLSKYLKDKKLIYKSFLLLEGVNYDSNDNPLLYAKEYIDTNIIQFNMIRQRNVNYVD